MDGRISQTVFWGIVVVAFVGLLNSAASNRFDGALFSGAVLLVCWWFWKNR